MNIDNEDVNLSLTLSPTAYMVHTRLKNNSGSGVNSGAAMDKAFAASDHPLSELVWSPQKGLSLRCTNCNSDKKPLLLWNVGPSGNDLSPSHQSMRSSGDAVDREDLIISRAVVDEDEVLGDEGVTLVGPTRSLHTPEFGASRGECDHETNSMIEKENCMDEAFCCPQNVEIAGFADISRKDAVDGISDCCKGDQTINGLFSTEPITWKLPEDPVCSLPNLLVPIKPDHEITSASAETKENKANTPIPIPAFPLKKAESSAHRIMVCGGKDKEKALSHSDEESRTSIESHNSTRLFSKKGIKRRIDGDDDDQGLNHKSKRTKKMDSSFMKWISNMVKGLPDSTTSVKEDSSSASLTLAFPNNSKKKSDTGFQTIFQSLYCRNTVISDNGVRNENDNLCQKIVVCDKEVMNPINIISMEEKLTHEKSPTLDSLWVSRFSARTRRLEKCDELTLETDVGSMFPPEKLKNPTFSVTCFFCGNGHDLRKCPDVMEEELEDLVLKMSSFGDVEEFSCFCVRCFQLDHWAVSCPLAPSNGGSFITSYYSTACHLQLGAGKRVSTSNAPNSANDVKYDEMFPLYKIVIDKNKDGPSEIFHAIRNLLLSCSDILRWLDSNVSLSSLNGFFVRLRLRKMEKGAGTTSYYVARLTGDAREHNGCKSEKSILVDVGGVKASVASRFVSKNNFLEDEIKAWLYRTLDSGHTIPSLDELNSKLKNRKLLGL